MQTKERNSMIKGLGLDLCEISRMDKLLENDRFLNRFFTEAEAGYIRSKGKTAGQTAAGIYAAKEALAKALGTGITFDLKEIEVVHDEAGKPGYRLTGKAAEMSGGDHFLLSVSHDGGISAAVCVREQEH
jgi:phosphopantetheine--protein transferase-like protein